MIDPIEFGLKLSCVDHIIFLSLDSTEEPLTKSMQVGQKVWQLTPYWQQCGSAKHTEVIMKSFLYNVIV